MTKKKQRIQTVSALVLLLLLFGTFVSFFIKPYIEDAQTRRMLDDEDAYVTDSVRDPWIYVNENGEMRLFPEYMVGIDTLVIPDAVNGVAVTGIDFSRPLPTASDVRTVVFPKRFSVNGDDETKIFWFSGWESLEVVAFEEGATDLSGVALYQMTALKAVYLPKSMTGMYPWNLIECAENVTVYYAGTEQEWQALGRFAEVVSGRATVVFETPVPIFEPK